MSFSYSKLSISLKFKTLEMESTISLKEQWSALKFINPQLRIRDAAKEIGVSEAELVALGENNIQLQDEFPAILRAIESLGYVMALTRNDYCVHERKGFYKNISFNGSMGLAVNPDIDLRLFMSRWHFGFAVNENERLSLQFFDNYGNAIHKIYLTEKSNVNAFHELVNQFKIVEDIDVKALETIQINVKQEDNNEVDDEAFKTAWLNLKDTHDFFGMLKKFKISRTQAMRLAPENHTIQISLERLKQIFYAVADRSIPIMVFTANEGCIQIHTGNIQKLVETGIWFNVLDPEFNMHLNQTAIEEIWVVKKPTKDGIVTGIELFDNTGKIIAQFFGKRKPGIAESFDWRAVVNEFSLV